MDLFVSSGQQHLKSMQQFVEEGNTMALARETHSLKGSCRDICATHLANLCAQLEHYEHAFSAPEVFATLKRLEESFNRLRIILEASKNFVE